MEFFILIITFLLSFEFRHVFGELIEVSSQILENAYVATVLSSEDGKVFQLPFLWQLDYANRDYDHIKLLQDVENILKRHTGSAGKGEIRDYIGDHRVFENFYYLVRKHYGPGGIYPPYYVYLDEIDIDLEHVDQRVDVRLVHSQMILIFEKKLKRSQAAYKIVPYTNGYLFLGLEEGFHTIAAKILAFADTENGDIYHVKRIDWEEETTPDRLIEMWSKYVGGQAIVDAFSNPETNRRLSEYYGSIFEKIKPHINFEIGENFPMEPMPNPRKKNAVQELPKIYEVNPEIIECKLLATMISLQGKRNFFSPDVVYSHTGEQTLTEKSSKIINILLKHTDQLGEYLGDDRIFGLFLELFKDYADLPTDIVLRPTCIILEHISPKALIVKLAMTIVFFHQSKVALKMIPYENGVLLFRLQYFEWDGSFGHEHCARPVAFVNMEDENIYQTKINKPRIPKTSEEVINEWKMYAKHKNNFLTKGKPDSYLTNTFEQVKEFVSVEKISDKIAKGSIFQIKNYLRHFPVSILKNSGTNSTTSGGAGTHKISKTSIKTFFHSGSTSNNPKKSVTSEGCSSQKQ